eukprot:scaffold21265_cov131-Isochrysis_galbana.AAC.7
MAAATRNAVESCSAVEPGAYALHARSVLSSYRSRPRIRCSLPCDAAMLNAVAYALVATIVLPVATETKRPEESYPFAVQPWRY